MPFVVLLLISALAPAHGVPVQLVLNELVLNETSVTGELTFYGAGDNCPPSGAIAHPKIHKIAGGTGTYEDPITCASAPAWLPAGAKVYVPHYKKYFIMEDDCGECIDDWNNNRKHHIDGWLGPDAIHKGTTDCEVQLSLTSTTFVVNPSSTYEVDSASLFSCEGSTCKCIQSIIDPCKDEGYTCGNTCELPDDITCEKAAEMFMLSLNRFESLNDGKCSSASTTLKGGSIVCQAGSCGGP